MIDHDSSIQTPDLEPLLPEIGKQEPFQSPQGFFEGLPERTLLKAKQREQIRRRRYRLTGGFSIMAAAAVLLLIFLLPGPALHQERALTAVKALGDTDSVNALQTPSSKAKNEVKPVPVSINPKAEPKAENIGDVLCDLTDDELSQLAAVYGADGLDETSTLETNNIN